MKPLSLQDANGIQLSPLETVKLLDLLIRIGMENANPTPQDRAFARDYVLQAATLYPGYANKAGN